MSLPAGTTFGQYVVREPLGEGGMASVYRAYQPSLRRDVAVKVIGAQLAGQPAFLARFRREAEVLARLEHPNILSVFDYGEQDGQAYIVYRYIPGGTLWHRLGQPLPVATAVRLLTPVAAALDFAHAHGVIHRDIKPSNILLTEDETPIVADFGLARILESETSPSRTGEPLTQLGTGLGTPAYMAPEQIRGEELDGRADEYALGIVAYEMLTGAVPFAAATPEAVMAKHLYEPLPPPERQNPALTGAISAALQRALAREPGGRFPSCGAFLSALTQAAGAGGGGRDVPESLEQTRPWQPGERGSIGSAAAGSGMSDGSGMYVRPPARPPSEPSVAAGAAGTGGAAAAAGAAPPVSAGRSWDEDAPTVVSLPGIRPATPPPAAQSPAPGWQQPAAPAWLPPGGAAPAWTPPGGSGGPPAGSGRSARLPLIIGGAVVVLAAIVGAIALLASNCGGAGPKPAPTPQASTVSGNSGLPFKPDNLTPNAGAASATAAATTAPTTAPTSAPTTAPTAAPTAAPTKAPTAAPTVAPTAPPTVAPPPGGSPIPATILAQDGFTDGRTGLLENAVNDPHYQMGYQGGEYMIKLTDPSYTTIPEEFIPNSYDDATMAVDVRMVGGADNRFVVLGCRYTDNLTGYRVWLDLGAGTYRLFAIESNGDQRYLRNEQAAASILKGTATNRVALTCSGSTIALSINGATVASVKDPQAEYSSGQFLIGASTYTDHPQTIEARFDNLLVTKTPPNSAPVLLADTLADPGTGLFGAGTDVAKYSFSNGEFIIQKVQATGGLYGPYLPGQYADSTTSVDVRLAGTFTDRYVNIGCRDADTGGYHLSVIPADGTFRLLKDVQGQDTPTRLIDDTPSNAIKRNGELNRLSLSCVGNTLTVTINGTQVGQARDNSYTTGKTYIATGGDNLTAEAHFRNLVVTQR